MAKNILIFADGTGQAGGLRPDQRLSNVYKLYRATRTGPESQINPADQVAFYDPGLGTITTAGMVRLRGWETLKAVAGLAVGLGFNRNVIDCYEAILQRYEPGDRIFLFGFSRGGYTARAVANVLNLCGVPTLDGKGGPVPKTGRALRKIAKEAVVKVYGHGAGKPRDSYEAEREAIAHRFRLKYGAGTHPSHADVVPAFIGVFDSVAALGMTHPERAKVLVGLGAALGLATWGLGALGERFLGWPMWSVIGWTWGALAVAAGLGYGVATFRWAPRAVRSHWWRWFHFALWSGKNYDRYLDPRVPCARHALAIDERRTKFHRVGWGSSKDPNLADPATGRSRFEQWWFAGNHSDIGGSYLEEESRLSDISLDWMIEQATQLPDPMLLDKEKLWRFPSALGPQHCEYFAMRDAHPLWAKLRMVWSTSPRPIPTDGRLHPTVFTRLQAKAVQQCDQMKPYRPESLRNHEACREFYK